VYESLVLNNIGNKKYRAYMKEDNIIEKTPQGEKVFGYLPVVDTLAAKTEIPIGVINGSKKGPTIAVTGGLRATEYCGIEAAGRLYQSINPIKLSGRMLIVPVVNLPCFQFRTPWFNLTRSISPMDGRPINKVFPGNPTGPVTDRIAYKLFHEVILNSDYHIDFRGGDLNSSHLVHTIYLRIGKDIDNTSENMAKVFGLRYVLPGTPDIGHTSKGTLIYETVAAGIPSIISESGLGFRTQPLEKYIELHVEGTKNIMKHYGMLEGRPSRVEGQRFLDMEWQGVKAGVSGVFHAIADQGDLLLKDEIIGRITDIDGSEAEILKSPIKGVVHTMYPRRLVFPGDGLYTLLKINELTGYP
jgi:predicted deacylase